MNDSRKETVKKAVHFQKPDYRPLMYYGLDELEESDLRILS